MSGRRGLIAGVVAILLAGSGCVCCGNRSYGAAHEVGPDCEVPTCQRSQVYVFAVGGMNPAGMLALDAFREQLNRQGFAKVATGQAVHAGWMAREVRRIRDDEPDAVFVFVGSEAGGPTAVKLAEAAVADGLPVGGVVLIDPGANTPPPNGVRVLSVAGFTVNGTESVAVPDAGRFALPSDPRAVAAVTGLLNEVAAATARPVVVESAGWKYPHAPEPRPLAEARDPEWAFLFDRGTRPGSVPTGNAGLVPAAASATRSTPPAVITAEARR